MSELPNRIEIPLTIEHDGETVEVGKITYVRERTCRRFWTGAEMICSSCAHQMNNKMANYCSNCGAKVVDE